MKYMDDGESKQLLIDRMLAIVREDSPWLWGFNPYSAGAYHDWMYNAKPTQLVRDILHYRRIDPQLRAREQARWNQPILWPIGLLIFAMLALLVPAWRGLRAREQANALPDPMPAHRPSAKAADFNGRR